jgi:hypothetical protein
MKYWFTFSALTVVLVFVLAACGSEAAPGGIQDKNLPSAQELKEAGQEIFTTFSASIEAGDGTALHQILVADLRQRCTVEELEISLATGGQPFPKSEIRSIYVDMEDPSNALMQLTLLDQPNGGLGDLSAGFAVAFPFPLELEQEGWRLGFPAISLPTGDGCPFVGGSSQGEASVSAQRQADSIPQEVHPSLSLMQIAPPSAVLTLMSSSGGGEGQFTSSTLLQTDLPLVTLLEHYRQEVVQPNWELGQDTVTEDLAAITWTSRDDAGGSPSFGVLLITSSEKGLWWVRLWTGGSTDGSARLIDSDVRVLPVPAPTGPSE